MLVEVLKALSGVLGAVAWPIAVIVLARMFKDEVKQLILKIAKVSFRGKDYEVTAELTQRHEALKASIPAKEQIEAAERDDVRLLEASGSTGVPADLALPPVDPLPDREVDSGVGVPAFSNKAAIISHWQRIRQLTRLIGNDLGLPPDLIKQTRDLIRRLEQEPEIGSLVAGALTSLNETYVEAMFNEDAQFGAAMTQAYISLSADMEKILRVCRYRILKAQGEFSGEGT